MMTTLQHHSPLGPIQIAGVLGDVEPGEPFEVSDDVAARLLEQSDVFELVDGSASFFSEHTVPQLRELLRDRDLPTEGRKAELIARLEESDTQQTTGVPDVAQVIEPPTETTDDDTTETQGDPQ